MKYPFAVILIAILLILPLATGAAPKVPAPCKVYFLVVENDQTTAGLTMSGLNKPQASWYEKHGDRDKFSGICFVPPSATTTDGVTVAARNVSAKVRAASAPATAFAEAWSKPDGGVVYDIVWGEHLVSQPYTYSYQTQQQVYGHVNGTVTDDSGDTSSVQATTTTTLPVEHTQSGVSNYYVADGWLAIWDRAADGGKGAFTPIAPLHNHNWTKFSSASTSLLNDAMEQIKEREENRLALLKKQ